jgi:phosphoribosylaminoimidazole-succinocarboxamide synthase
MSRRQSFHQARPKLLFRGPEPGTMIRHFTDEAATLDDRVGGSIAGKGVLSNRISEFLMRRLAEIGIPTHLMRRLNMREQLVREVEIIPLGVVVRNIAAGCLARRLDIAAGTVLPRSILEYYYKGDVSGDRLVSEEHITAFGWASVHEVDEIVGIALRVNDFLGGLFLGIGIRLVDFRLEFGRLYSDDDMRIVIAGEISPDNCRLWDLRGDATMPEDRCRADLGRAAEGYREVARRLGILPESGPGDFPAPDRVQ